MTHRPRSLSSALIASWGIFGVLLLLSQAIWRLTPLALEPIQKNMLTPALWVLYIGWALLNAYMEGYRGFHRSYSPMVAARALHLGEHPKPLHVLLAPFFCMAFFAATRARLIVSWTLLGVISFLIWLMRQVPQPWRGIIDIGVVVGLAWGTLSIVVWFIRGLQGKPIPAKQSFPQASDPPDSESSKAQASKASAPEPSEPESSAPSAPQAP